MLDRLWEMLAADGGATDAQRHAEQLLARERQVLGRQLLQYNAVLADHRQACEHVRANLARLAREQLVLRGSIVALLASRDRAEAGALALRAETVAQQRACCAAELAAAEVEHVELTRQRDAAVRGARAKLAILAAAIRQLAQQRASAALGELAGELCAVGDESITAATQRLAEQHARLVERTRTTRARADVGERTCETDAAEHALARFEDTQLAPHVDENVS